MHRNPGRGGLKQEAWPNMAKHKIAATTHDWRKKLEVQCHYLWPKKVLFGYSHMSNSTCTPSETLNNDEEIYCDGPCHVVIPHVA